MRLGAVAVAQPGARIETTPIPSDCASPAKESRAVCLAIVLLTAGAAMMACPLALLPAAGHDQMWFLLMAQRMLHGARLYGPEIFDSNPPLIVWLSAVPVTLAGWLHLPPTAVGKGLVVAIEAGVWAVCLRMTRRIWPELSRTAVWALAFAYIAVFADLPARDFGQRDHLLAVLSLPYLLAAAMAIEGRPVRGWRAAVLGIVAAVGFALKPHQLLVAAAVEAVVLGQRRAPARGQALAGPRRVRAETLALCITCVGYLAAVRVFAPQYFAEALPILRDTYWAIGGLSLRTLFLQAIQLHILAGVAIVLFLAGRPAFEQRRASPARTVSLLLLTAGVAATAAYYLQGTGWYYQQLPALSFFALAAWIELMALADRLCAARQGELPSLRWMPWAAGGLAALSVVLTAYFSGYDLAHAREFPSGLAADPDPGFFADLTPGTPVAILTTEVDLSIPPVYTRGLYWAQRTNNLWLLPAILRNEAPGSGDPKRRIAPARLAELDALQHAWMVEDLTRWRPQLILIQRCQDPAVRCQVLEDRRDDLLAWFKRDAAFRAVFARYQYLRSSGPFDAYVLR